MIPTASHLLCVLSLSVSAIAVGHAQDTPTPAAARFDQLDRNHDGRVSADEYDGKAVFAALDANQNYRLSLDEVQTVLGADRDGQLSAADRLRVADLNGDGALSQTEVSRFAEMRFQRLDSNHDDQLTLAEFQSGFWRR